MRYDIYTEEGDYSLDTDMSIYEIDNMINNCKFIRVGHTLIRTSIINVVKQIPREL